MVSNKGIPYNPFPPGAYSLVEEQMLNKYQKTLIYKLDQYYKAKTQGAMRGKKKTQQVSLFRLVIREDLFKEVTFDLRF